jgi:molecular chaperone GrpE
MPKHKREETPITENITQNAAEEAVNVRDPHNAPVPEQGKIPETAGDTPEAAADTGTTAENGETPQTETPGDARPLTAEECIAGLEVKLAEANDLYLRKAADFENYRKRMNQEKQSAIDYANQTLFQDLILVIDDFERAIKSAESRREAAGGDGEQIAAGYNSLYEGITMIEKNLVSQLENKWGLKRFDSAGEPFDPNRHEAIMMEKSADIEEPVVAEDFIKGYILKDRVIRPAKVKVLMPENA